METRQNQNIISRVKVANVISVFILTILFVGSYANHADADFIMQSSSHFEEISRTSLHQSIMGAVGGFSSEVIFGLFMNGKHGNGWFTGGHSGDQGDTGSFHDIVSYIEIGKKPGWFGHNGSIRPGNPHQPHDSTNPVPEPATMLLFGTGLLGLAGSARLRKIKKS